MYHVTVYQEDCGELVIDEVVVEDRADSDMLKFVVYCYKPGT